MFRASVDYILDTFVVRERHHFRRVLLNDCTCLCCKNKKIKVCRLFEKACTGNSTNKCCFSFECCFGKEWEKNYKYLCEVTKNPSSAPLGLCCLTRLLVCLTISNGKVHWKNILEVELLLFKILQNTYTSRRLFGGRIDRLLLMNIRYSRWILRWRQSFIVIG